MRVIRTWVVGKRIGALVLFVGLVAGCGRVAAPETESGGADSAGATGASGMPARGGSNDGSAGGPMLPSAGANSGGFGGVFGSSGDSGAAGAAGAHPAEDLPLPADCEAHEPSATDAECRLNVTCHGEPDSIHCQRLDSGDWQCTCSSAYRGSTLEIGGAAGLQACAVAAGLCSVNGLTLDEGPCTENPDFPHEDSCGLDLTCRKPIVSQQVAGVQATLVESGRARCNRLAAPSATGGQAPYTCTCSIINLQSYTVLDNDATHSCRSLLDFCLTGKQPSFGTTSSCTANSEIVEPGHCKSLQLCGPQMQLSGAASLIDPSLQRTLTCDQLESGDVMCTCDMESTQTSVGSGYNFQVAEATLSKCDPALCLPDVAPEPTGPVGDCAPGEPDIHTDTCAVPFVCPVPAAIAGQQVTIQAPLSVSCAKRAIDDTWWCACGSGANTTKFELGAASGSEEACGLAPPHCLAQMSLQLGPSEWGGAPLPNPLP